jgi:integrase
MHDPQVFASMRFIEAAADYLQSRKDELRPRSYRQLQQDLKQAGKFFGELKLSEIHIGNIKEYQEARRENMNGVWKRRANGSIINHEISAVQSMLKRAVEADGRTLWSRIEPFYKPLRTPPVRPVKVLSDEDDMLYFGTLEHVGGCELIHWVTSITEMSGAAGKELRTLRMKDVHLDARVPWIWVREEIAKNEYRERVVVLNTTAARHMKCCVDRGMSLGSTAPDHYVFPGRDRYRQQYDPAKPASESWLRRQLVQARKATGLKTVTPHMFRHMHITLSMEAGEDPEFIAKRVGHESINMTRYYTHDREQTQHAAVSRIDPSVRFAPKGTPRLVAKIA